VSSTCPSFLPLGFGSFVASERSVGRLLSARDRIRRRRRSRARTSLPLLSFCLFVVGKDFVAAREAREQRKEKRGTERGRGFWGFFPPKVREGGSSRTRALEER
jgi:hypothetical protein